MSDDLDKRAYFRSLPSYGPDWDAAIEYGIDMDRLEKNLRLTPQERLEQLMAMQRLAAELAPAIAVLRRSASARRVIGTAMPFDVLDVVDEAIAAPASGLPKLWRLAADAKTANDSELFCAVGDVLLPLLIHNRCDLELGLALASELVKIVPDSAHLAFQDQVLKQLGRVAEVI